MRPLLERTTLYIWTAVHIGWDVYPLGLPLFSPCAGGFLLNLPVLVLHRRGQGCNVASTCKHKGRRGIGGSPPLADLTETNKVRALVVLVVLTVSVVFVVLEVL